MPFRKILFILFIAAIALAAIRPVQVAGSSHRLLNALDMDEALHLNIIRQVLTTDSWQLEFSNYGHLYFNLCLMILYPLKFLIPVSDQLIIVILRIVPLLAAFCILLFTYRLADRYWNAQTAFLSVILLTFIPPHFFRFSVMSHPDILQSLFILLAVMSLIRLCDGHFNSVWLTALFSGLAFSCKYGGIFILGLMFILTPLLLIARRESLRIPDWLSFKTVFSRILWLTFGLVLTAGGFLIFPDIIAGVMSSDGQINNPVLLQMIPLVRKTALFTGSLILLLGVLEIKQLRQGLFKTGITLLNQWIRILIAASAVFVLAFLLTSPASFVGFNFISGIIYEAHHTATGHIFIEQPAPWIWLEYLANPRFYFSRPLLAVLMAGLIFQAIHIIRNRTARTLSAENIVWIWVLFFLLFLVLRIQMARPRYLLTILPCLTILLAVYLVRFYDLIRTRLPSVRLRNIWTVLAFLLLTIQTAAGIQNIKQRYDQLVHWEDTDSAVKAGRWLGDHVPHEALILADQFSYLPPVFQNIRITYYADESLLHQIDPDYVMTNHRVTYAYEDSSLAGKHRNGAGYFMTRYQYYQGLKNGSLGYQLLKDFDTVRIYRKKRMQ